MNILKGLNPISFVSGASTKVLGMASSCVDYAPSYGGEPRLKQTSQGLIQGKQLLDREVYAAFFKKYTLAQLGGAQEDAINIIRKAFVPTKGLCQAKHSVFNALMPSVENARVILELVEDELLDRINASSDLEQVREYIQERELKIADLKATVQEALQKGVEDLDLYNQLTYLNKKLFGEEGDFRLQTSTRSTVHDKATLASIDSGLDYKNAQV